MGDVLLALIPVVAGALYWFGWRVVVMLILANGVGFLAEYLFVRKDRQPVTSAVFVTATLLVLSLPPALPLWMVVLGTVFAVAFGKMMFGGFGRNVFNPAMVGRAFLYVSFGGPMTAQWSEPFAGGLGGLAAYLPDAVTAATPGMLLKKGIAVPWESMFLGATPGTIGGTSALLAILGGVLLLVRKTANYRIVISAVAGFVVAQGLFWIGAVRNAPDPWRAMMAGSFLIGVFFYATEPVTASNTNIGRWIYGAFIGVMSSVIGLFSVWPAGTMFAILLANIFAPILDYTIKAGMRRREAA